MHVDQVFVETNNVVTDKPLHFEIEMKELVRVEDVYKDITSFSKTLKKGQGSGSPYSDYEVVRKFFPFKVFQ